MITWIWIYCKRQGESGETGDLLKLEGPFY